MIGSNKQLTLNQCVYVRRCFLFHALFCHMWCCRSWSSECTELLGVRCAGADSPGRWAPGCPRQSCSVCRCAGTSRPGHRSRGRAAPVQPSGGAAGSGMRAPASRHANRRRALATSLLLRLFHHETDDRFCSCCACCLPVMHTAAARATLHRPGAPEWWTELF